MFSAIDYVLWSIAFGLLLFLFRFRNAAPKIFAFKIWCYYWIVYDVSLIVASFFGPEKYRAAFWVGGLICYLVSGLTAINLCFLPDTDDRWDYALYVLLVFTSYLGGVTLAFKFGSRADFVHLGQYADFLCLVLAVMSVVMNHRSTYKPYWAVVSGFIVFRGSHLICGTIESKLEPRHWQHVKTIYPLSSIASAILMIILISACDKTSARSLRQGLAAT